jgi:hypothetical protein
MKIKNETCEIEITSNPRRQLMRANHYYGVELLSGTWPDLDTLIAACDNRAFGQQNSSFGGRVEYSSTGKSAYVTVYVD